MLEGALDCVEDGLLGGFGGSCDSCTGGCAVSTAAELAGDLVDVEAGVLGTEADAGEVTSGFFEEAGDDDGLDTTEVIDEAFAIVGGCACAGVIGLAEVEAGGLVFVVKLEAFIDFAEEFDAGEGEGLVDFLGDDFEIGAVLDEVGGGFEGRGESGGVLEGASICGDGGVEIIGDGGGDGPVGVLDELVDEFSGGGFVGADPIEVAVLGIGGVVVDIDHRGIREDGLAGGAEALG